VEVLHFDWLPTLALPERLLMSTASPDQPGTLGWFSRWTGIWQTRLLLISCNGPEEIRAARRLAAALLARGGPAVVIEGLQPPYPAGGLPYSFYEQIVHDSPLDAALAQYLQPGHYQTVSFCPSLFAGAGREEGLRTSKIGQSLVELEEDLSGKKSAETRRQESELTELIKRQPAKMSEKPTTVVLRSGLAELKAEWPTYTFDSHERDGLIPLSRKLCKMRSGMGVRGSATWTHAYASRTVERRALKRAPQGRYVNSSFWMEQSDGTMERLDQKQARLRVSEVCHLGIQIGPKDVHIYTAGATAIFEEVFKWTPEMEGVWVEIGVTGLDFEVLGDPVQELWLPREGASETVYFAVVPKTAGMARLRFCLYYKQNIIQSFRLAAITVAQQDAPMPAAQRRAALARGLGLPLQEMKDVGYAPRLEYSVTAGVDGVGSRPERALSLVANDLDGDSVVTVKGADTFGVRTNRDLSGLVSRVRKALQEISTPPLDGVDREWWQYGFGLPGKMNAGDEPRIKAALQRLAALGWELFDKIIPQQCREEMERALEPERRVIHVAHVLLEKVIPWGVVYDRFYDPDKQVDDEGNPVAFDVCLSPLSGLDGTTPSQACGESPDCLLHPDRVRQRRESGLPVLLPETVICPLHFWGFKHIVEVPPQQVKETATGTRPLENRILTEGTVQMAAAVNAKLSMAEQHLGELEALCSGIAAQWRAKEYRRDAVLLALKNTSLDFIYFYGHARGGEADPTANPPYLEVQAKEDPQPGIIKPGQLSYNHKWDHHPLVFLNGCGTVGYSPDALSPFIEKLVQDRGAAGVIGTEIPVWEALASEFAKLFLGAFLKGTGAGEALLQARRALLSQSNPLGLVYTLYAAAELSLSGIGNNP
jgi:hypothetical protein